MWIPILCSVTNVQEQKLQQFIVDYLLNAQDFNWLFKLHPWILTEISNLSMSFFRNYTSYLVKWLLQVLQQQEQLSTFAEQKENAEQIQDIQRRILYLYHRSQRLRFGCNEVLRLLHLKLGRLQFLPTPE